MTNIQIQIPPFIRQIAKEFAAINVCAYVVGGYVRDEIKRRKSDDLDICLTGIDNPDSVAVILSKFGHCKAVGKNFPIWLLTTPDGGKYDFALARIESKAGCSDSRTDFNIIADSSITIEDDLARRDLTINAIAYEIPTGKVIDPFNGVKHLLEGIAHPVSEAFMEDPIRVIRAARFIPRFGLKPSALLKEYCRAIVPNRKSLPPDQVGKELTKLLSQTDTPSMFFRFLKEVDWLGYHFPELDTLIGVPQENEWHPEGDVFEHTMHCMDAAKTPFMRVTMLCHDLGKATTTEMIGGKWKAPGHAKAGVEPTLAMLKRIVFGDTKLQNQIAMLVETHMFHVNEQFSRKAVGRMINRLASVGLSFDDLVEVCRCDVSGRPPLPGFTPYIGQDIAKGFEVQKGQKIKPIVNGGMLIPMGYKSGPELGQIKARLLEEQMAGNLNENNWREFL